MKLPTYVSWLLIRALVSKKEEVTISFRITKWDSLKNFKQSIQKWNKLDFGYFGNKIQNLERELNALDIGGIRERWTGLKLLD